MSTQRFLFENFLDDRKVYLLNQGYWGRQLSKLLPETDVVAKNWISNAYVNGQKIYDGNPIYTVLVKPDRGIRIIQEKPDSAFPEIGAWIQKTENRSGEPIQELVISLELSTLTKEIAIKLMQMWAQGHLNEVEIEKIITFFKREADTKH